MTYVIKLPSRRSGWDFGFCIHTACPVLSQDHIIKMCKINITIYLLIVQIESMYIGVSSTKLQC